VKIIKKPNPQKHYLAIHVDLLISSYYHWTGKELVKLNADDKSIQAALYNAPYCVVSHNTEAIPIFNYGNKTALRLFEMDWATFTTLPSQNSAEPINQAEREQLLSRVSTHGFIDDYRGVRISSTGRQFLIEDATVWNIIDKKGVYYGQAALFYNWSELK
jgi:hypothetical protein